MSFNMLRHGIEKQIIYDSNMLNSDNLQFSLAN